MHSSNKKRIDILTREEIDDWYDYWPYDFDDYCGPNCDCRDRSFSEYEDFYQKIAEAVADVIIKQQNLNFDVKETLVNERMEVYTSWYNGLQIKLNQKVKEDIAFIWPYIKNTEMGFELFSEVFGQKEKYE